MSGSIYVVGGAQKPDAARRQEWNRYAAARIVELDPGSGTCRTCVDYVSPPHVTAPQDASALFKAATVSGDRMYACTSTEVLTYDLPSFRLAGYVTHPWLNDVHQVAPTDRGTLLVVNTGLDMVMEVAEDGTLVRYWSVTGSDPFERFDRNTDYRRIATTKPHAAHANFVFELDGRLWATLFLDRAAVCLDEPTLRMNDIAAEGIHDGIVSDGAVWFTSVDGTLIAVDGRTRRVTERIDLNAIMGRDMPLGWCRGLTLLEGGKALVGFSRLRPTRLQENIGWVKWKAGARGWGLAPTRIACIDLPGRTLLWEHEVESSGINTIFSIHVVSGDPGPLRVRADTNVGHDALNLQKVR